MEFLPDDDTELIFSCKSFICDLSSFTSLLIKKKLGKICKIKKAGDVNRFFTHITLHDLQFCIRNLTHIYFLSFFLLQL